MVLMEVGASALVVLLLVVLVVTDQVGHMEVVLVVMGHMVEENLVDMEDMVVVLGLTGESHLWVTRGDMVVALTEVMTWEVDMVGLVMATVDMEVFKVVAMELVMMLAWGEVASAVLVVEVPTMEAEGDMAVLLLRVIILMEDRSFSRQDIRS